MEHVRVCVAGAGPSGLTVAHQLLDRGETSLVVLEAEAEAGGLCRSVEVDGAPLDIGGGHFLDTARPSVLAFLFRFMPADEWREHTRISKIAIRRGHVDYPLEANLWQLPVDDQVDFLEAIARAGCVRGDPAPADFEGWCRWKLGSRIADEYMLPYNRKIWSHDLRDLGTYWLHKLPDVSFRETVKSCLLGKPQGTIPAHGRFLYPRRHGFGEVWRRMGEALGGRLRLSTPVCSLDWKQRVINGNLSYEVLLTSVPWPVLARVAAFPAEITAAVTRLIHTTIDVDYRPERVASDAHWIYEPTEGVAHHRMLLRQNFVAGSAGHWTETNAKRNSVASGGFRHRNEFAYPLNTVQKPAAIGRICGWASQHAIVPIGRWGLWEHMNSDVAVARALDTGSRLRETQ